MKTLKFNSKRNPKYANLIRIIRHILKVKNGMYPQELKNICQRYCAINQISSHSYNGVISQAWSHRLITIDSKGCYHKGR